MYTATSGSSALKLEYAPQKYREISERITREHIEQERRREKQERIRRAEAKKRAKKLKFRIMLTTLVCITFAIFAVVVTGYSKISSMTLQANQLKDTVKAYENEIEALKLDISMATDIEVIKEKAKDDLGMNPPKDYQYYELEMKEQGIDLNAEQPELDETLDSIRELLD